MSPGENRSDAANASGAELYTAKGHDQSIIAAAKKLLWKLVRCSFIDSRQLGAVSKALTVLERLPQVSEEHDIVVQLSGPRRWYGEHEIWHHWEVCIEGHFLQVSSGGHFYRDSTGGDSFTCMEWWAQPGSETQLRDYFADPGMALWLVNDAMPFDQEVDAIDLSEPGYSLAVHVDGDVVTTRHAGEDEED